MTQTAYRRPLATISALILFGCGWAMAKPIEDQAERATDLLRSYLRIDTSNPPGNEAVAVDFLANILHGAGHSTRRFVSPEGRHSLLAKISATNATRGHAPLLLLHHIDVVPAGVGWTTDPFGADLSGGKIHGRGAIDSKSLGIAHLLTFLELGKEPERLDRDLWFLASADEEAGGGQGVGWIFDRYPEELSVVGAVLTEAGVNRTTTGDPLWWGLEIAQKRPLWLRLSTRARGGHGSGHHPSSATHTLIRALDELLALELEPRLTTSSYPFFKGLVPYHGSAFGALFDHPTLEQAQAALSKAANENRLHRSLLPGMVNYLLDTVQVTRLANESTSVNVISATASAEIDIRLLPDTNEEEFLERAREALGKDVRVEVLLRSDPVPDPTLDEPVYLRLAEFLSESGPVVPTFIPGTTDSRYFRERNIAAYGFSPFLLKGKDARGIHGADESIPVKEFLDGVRRMEAATRAIVSQ